MVASKNPLRAPNPRTILEELERLAAEKRRATDPMPSWRLRAMDRGRERAKVQRHKSGRRKAHAKWRETHKRTKPGARSYDRLMRVMAPGEWYGRHDVGRAAGLKRDTTARAMWCCWIKGWVRRVANPAWDPAKTYLTPWMVAAGMTLEPKWLYQITDAGIAELSLSCQILP